jgi:hypothetical protein
LETLVQRTRAIQAVPEIGFEIAVMGSRTGLKPMSMDPDKPIQDMFSHPKLN